MTLPPWNSSVVDELRRAGVATGQLIALAIDDGGDGSPRSAAMAVDGASAVHQLLLDDVDVAELVRHVDTQIRPRWIMWSNATAISLIRAGVRVATAWDIAAVHRLQVGGWRSDPALVWAHTSALDADSIPHLAPIDLFSTVVADDELEEPVGGDGHLRPEWSADHWVWNGARLAKWAELALQVALRQQQWFAQHADARAAATARSESTAELLCAELSVDGLPMDRATAESIVQSHVGPRPAHELEAAAARRARDERVLSLVPGGADLDLRNPPT